MPSRAAKPGRKDKKMFKKFLAEIIAAKDDDEMTEIFGRADRAYQQEKLTWKEQQMLLDLVNKFYEWRRK